MKTAMQMLRAAVVFLAVAVNANQVLAEELTPPPFAANDRFDVNTASNQLTTHVQTVAIGGELGLAHSISTFSNSFLPAVGDITHGYNDLYRGKARYEWAARDITYKGSYYPQLHFMRVYHGSESQDFEVIAGGFVQAHITKEQEDKCLSEGTCGRYTYRAARDARHTLEAKDDYLIWTKPDGTQVKYYRGTGRRPTGSAHLQEIVYPNGLTLSIVAEWGAVHSVTTNSGYQLKYFYEIDDSRVALDKTLTPISQAPANTLKWSRYNPARVVGLNNSVEFCSTATYASCEFNYGWPTATITWPKGMPRAMVAGNSTFKVKNAGGQIVEYHFVPFDTNDIEPFTGMYIEPRLIGIKEATSQAINLHYSYKNIYTNKSIGDGFSLTYSFRVVGDGGRLDKAWGTRGTFDYPDWVHAASQFEGDIRSLGADMSVRMLSPILGAFHSIETLDGTYEFETIVRNRVKVWRPNDGPTEHYDYDSRGNVVKVTYNYQKADESFAEAEYPASCDAANRKICNKPVWVSDARGNKTYYTYHAPSGQVASVTSPADGEGKKHQSRFEYEQKYANVKNSSGVLTVAKKPIWLKTQESYCIDSNYANGACAGSDEVVTAFEYEHDNLHLTGLTVTADGETLRTCYQYDAYGNRIGEIGPKANLNSCDQ